MFETAQPGWRKKNYITEHLQSETCSFSCCSDLFIIMWDDMFISASFVCRPLLVKCRRRRWRRKERDRSSWKQILRKSTLRIVEVRSFSLVHVFVCVRTFFIFFCVCVCSLYDLCFPRKYASSVDCELWMCEGVLLMLHSALYCCWRDS